MSGEVLSVELPLGTHIITLRVADSLGETDTDEILMSVVDTVPPEILANIVPTTLWPPNHQMVEITTLVSTSDLCGIPSVLLESIQSDEPDNAEGAGDGNTVDDVQGADAGTADFSFQLRAERSGTGEGRTYTVTYGVPCSSIASCS